MYKTGFDSSQQHWSPNKITDRFQPVQSEPRSVTGCDQLNFTSESVGGKLVCTYYDADLDEFKTIEATLKQISRVGILLETPEPIQVEMPIHVRFTAEGGQTASALTPGEHARVTNCDRSLDDGKSLQYRVNAAFFEPLDEHEWGGQAGQARTGLNSIRYKGGTI